MPRLLLLAVLIFGCAAPLAAPVEPSPVQSDLDLQEAAERALDEDMRVAGGCYALECESAR